MATRFDGKENKTTESIRHLSDGQIDHYVHRLLDELLRSDSVERREGGRRKVTLQVEKDRRACPCGLCQARPERRSLSAQAAA